MKILAALALSLAAIASLAAASVEPVAPPAESADEHDPVWDWAAAPLREMQPPPRIAKPEQAPSSYG